MSQILDRYECRPATKSCVCMYDSVNSDDNARNHGGLLMSAKRCRQSYDNERCEYEGIT